MNPHSFRAYDIRGDADADLTADFCRALGRASRPSALVSPPSRAT